VPWPFFRKIGPGLHPPGTGIGRNGDLPGTGNLSDGFRDKTIFVIPLHFYLAYNTKLIIG
jgi:hypothetical protein